MHVPGYAAQCLPSRHLPAGWWPLLAVPPANSHRHVNMHPAFCMRVCKSASCPLGHHVRYPYAHAYKEAETQELRGQIFLVDLASRTHAG
eukprot:1159012-Pelagomonas_calceolata.AAC.8